MSPRDVAVSKISKVILSLSALALSVAMPAVAAEPAPGSIDINALTQETQRSSNEADRMTLVWWMPHEFWRATLEQNAGAQQQQIEQALAVLKRHTLVAVMDGSIGPFGAVTYTSEAALRARLRIKDPNGVSHDPLPDAAVDADVRQMLQMLKPALAAGFGRVGENLCFVVFTATDKQGRPLVDPRREGTFSVSVGERDFRWKLPLASLVPPRVCPSCKEKLSGAYRFCPWDGAALAGPPAANATDR